MNLDDWLGGGWGGQVAVGPEPGEVGAALAAAALQ